MNTRNATLAVALLLAAIASGIGIGRAVATGAPTQAPLTYAGTLTDQDGKPYATAQDVTLKVFDAASGGTAKCTANTVQAEAATGNFQVTLPADCVQAVRDQSELWTELTVGATKTVLPRTKLGAVPYALEADTAKVAGSAAAASGGLKTQVEGIVADVAGLKAGGGSGGPWLVDANGVKLGKAFYTGGAFMWVVTSSTYGVLLWMSGEPYDAVAAGSVVTYFSGPNCTGDTYFGANAPNLGIGLPNAYYLPGMAAYIVSTAKPGSPWPGAPVTVASTLDSTSSKCKNFNPDSQLVRPGKLMTPAQLGLPDKIVGPLSYVP